MEISELIGIVFRDAKRATRNARHATRYAQLVTRNSQLEDKEINNNV